MEKIIDVISKQYDSFTKSHQAVARYIMENYDESAFMTLEQLSASAGVSTTSVIRFAKELGYDGYSSMQKALRIDLRTKASLPDRLEYAREIPDDDVLKRVIYTDINNIEQTFKMIDYSSIEKAIELISDAGDIYLLGLRRSFSLAIYAFSRLGQVRSNVRLIGASGLNYPEEIINASDRDVCLAFCFPRYSRTTIALLDYMKKLGVKTIIVTGLNHLAVDPYADIILPCETSCFSGKTSYVAPLSLINYILALYVSRNRANAYQMLNRTEDILSRGTFQGL